jgi:hypothetical protein
MLQRGRMRHMYIGPVASSTPPQKPPSRLIQQLTKQSTHVNGWRPKPEVVELLNIAEHSHQVRRRAACCVRSVWMSCAHHWPP